MDNVIPRVERNVVTFDPVTLTVYLSNGYSRHYDLTKVYDMSCDEGDKFAMLILGCGLTEIEHTDNLLGRLYYGTLQGWTPPVPEAEGA